MTAAALWFGDTEILFGKGFIRKAEVAPECYENIRSPEPLIAQLKKANQKFDLLVFGQRFPDTVPHFNYPVEGEAIAVIPIRDFNHWCQNQITKETRKNIGKATRKGVVVKLATFDDELARGIVSIYNESPVRQGKAFLHYGKTFELIKKQHMTYLENSVFIGAYYSDQLIGFIKLFFSGQCASTMQVISKIEHRDKKPTNALIAKAVDLCTQRGIPYLQYGLWSEGGLGDFKRHNGFEKFVVPTYYVPLTVRGELAIRVALHQGLWRRIPNRLKAPLLDLRRKWYGQKGGIL